MPILGENVIHSRWSLHFLMGLTKQSNPQQTSRRLSPNQEDQLLCPAPCLHVYENSSVQEARNRHAVVYVSIGSSQPCIIIHNCKIKQTLHASGLDVSTFLAHSIMGDFIGISFINMFAFACWLLQLVFGPRTAFQMHALATIVSLE